MDYFAPRLFTARVGEEVYDVRRFYISTKIVDAVKVVKKYFRVLDRLDIPYKHKRRKSYVEYAELSVMMLARIDSFCQINRPIAIGSSFLSPVPWAVFGESKLFTQNNFKNIDELGEYYESYMAKDTPFYPAQLHFRVASPLATQLAEKHDKTPHYIMTVALLLMHDLIVNGGPDCDEFFDIYTNDFQEEAETIDILEWENIRCKVLGSDGRIKNNPYKVSLGQVRKPSIPLVTTAHIEEIKFDHLSQGEKVTPYSKVVVPEDYDYEDGCGYMGGDCFIGPHRNLSTNGDPWPEDWSSLSEDGRFVQSDPELAVRMKKYNHLFNRPPHKGYPNG